MEPNEMFFETIAEIKIEQECDVKPDDKTKCGEIFALLDGNFILICGFCNDQFGNMRLFGGHVREKHGGGLKPEKIDPELQVDPISTVIMKDEIDISVAELSKDESQHSRANSPMVGSESESNEDDGDDEKQTTSSSRGLLTLGDPNFFCYQCNRQLNTKKTFQRHQAEHRKKGEASLAAAVDQTDLTVKDPSLFCDLCERYFKTKHTLMQHAQHHNTLPLVLKEDPDFLKCKFCDELFENLAEKNAHENTEHIGNRPYICPYCKCGYSSVTNRNRHIRSHTGERPFKCDKCPRSYTNNADLKHHIKRHLNERDFPCDTCGKRFFRKVELTIHMRLHTGLRPYVCEDCGLSFATTGHLYQHQIRHKKIKNFKCDICDKSFYSKWILKDHQIGHTDAQPFECEVCKRPFSRWKALKKHLKLHSGVKEYVCNICGKQYAQNSGLYAHKKTHGI